MVFFITFLRAVAAMIITNSHYVGVYPTDLIANGGLFGDVIFFAVSGFCLYNIRDSWKNAPKWYLKRIVRCYIAPVLITALYLIIGLYRTPENVEGWFELFIYPTNYHFVASIIVLYIPFFFVAKTDKLRKNLPFVMAGVLLLYLAAYAFMYDKSYYHIDKVREPMIRFLFFEAMLLGAHFRGSLEKYRNKIKISDWIICGISFVLYFASKLVFSKMESISNFQIVNQAVLLVLLYFTLKCFAGIDSLLEAMPQWIKKAISYIAEITLEIYVVQYALIPIFAKIAPFPVNWLIVTGAILGMASLLRVAVKYVNKLIKI